MFPICSTSGNTVHLRWNPYYNWSGGVAEYRILRSLNSSGFTVIQSVSGNTTDYDDDVSTLSGQKNSGRICYKVEAASNTQNISLSAEVCIDLSANIYIPNAFTPNGDGVNDIYKPSFAFLPGSYRMLIYNRNGTKLFESTDVEKGWNGQSQTENSTEVC